ncbi:MAG: response regulator transcription factor [Vallitaleaceae bacterium]|nr:response regulator transcription factor [Vallitaleaceae bacterium]
MKVKILIVDDDQDILELIEICLKHEGYEVVKASNGVEAVEKMDASVNLILLDVMMPRMDGIKTCIEIRKSYNVPIIFLTAKTQDNDQILGLQVGADDYIKKPFTPTILIAKIKATLRRYQVLGADLTRDSGTILVKDLCIDEKAFRVQRNNTDIQLTKTEFEILLLLAKNRGQVFSIQKIYTSIWKEAYFDDSANTVMVHIKRLRNKIEDGGSQVDILQTVWGVGYKID